VRQEPRRRLFPLEHPRLSLRRRARGRFWNPVATCATLRGTGMRSSQ
jgi:hypothetical protein